MSDGASRRRVLALTGGALAGGLAGCSGETGEGSPTDTFEKTAHLGTPGPSTTTRGPDAGSGFRFTSFPDFFNSDIPSPQPGWDDALSWFLNLMKSEGPAFSLVAGDIMDARWWGSRKQVRHLANLYWGGWVQRMRDHDVTFYVAPGDHEYGDDPWETRHKRNLVPAFEQAFRRHFDMPRNGPEGEKGLAYYVRKDNALFVTVDTFELRGGEMHVSVTGKQLAWVDRVLEAHADADWVVVQGHVPVLKRQRHRNSSRLYLEGGRNSKFWQTLTDHGVDVYLCGEHHAMTARQRDGIWHVAHGALWGVQSPVNYLVGRVRPESLRLELKRFPLAYGDGYIWQRNRQTLYVRNEITIPQKVRNRGPSSAGVLVLEPCREGACIKRQTGEFA